MVEAATDSIHVKITDPSLMEQSLNEAVNRVTPLASARGHGILVKRLGPGSFIVAASADVPFGESHQESLW